MITLEYDGLEKWIDDWGVSNPRRNVLNQGFDHLAFDIDGDYLGADLFPFSSKVILRIGRNGSGTAWTGGKIDFIGYRVELFRSADGMLENMQYKFEGMWGFFFERKVFQQAYQSYNNATHANETLYRSQIVLGQAADNSKMGLRDQINEIANWVINQTATEYGAPQLQLGDSYPDGYIPFDAVNNITSSESLARCFRWIGGESNSVWFDYNTTPPMLHCKARAILPAVTLPAVGAEKLKFTRRDDLVPPAVCLKYRVSIQDGENRFTKVCEDITSPNGSGYTDLAGVFHGTSTLAQLRADALKFGAVVETFDFEGPKYSQLKGSLTTVPFNPTSLDFWRTFCPELAADEVTNLTIVPDADGDSYKLSRALADPSLTYAVVTGGVAGFMANPARIQKLTVTAYFSATINTFDGRQAHVWNACQKQVQITVTNVPQGTYFKDLLTDLAEEIPFGLSQQVFNAETPAPYQGTHTITEDEYSAAIGVGNVLNVAGGEAEYETMRAQVQSIQIDYTAGSASITVGPAKHLGAGDLIDRLRAERGPRAIYYIGFNRTNDPNADVIDLSGPAVNNSTSGPPMPAYLAAYETNNTGAAGQEQMLGKAFFDGQNKAMGVQGVPYVSESGPGDGAAIIQLGDITSPPASVGGTPLTKPQARKRAIHLREIPFFDTDGKKYFQIALASEIYSKTSDDGSLAGGGGIKQMIIKSTTADWLVCHTWYQDSGGTTYEGATDILVAKQLLFRRAYTHQVVDTLSYTFNYGDDNNRTSTDQNNVSQTECSLPRIIPYTAPSSSAYVPNGIIYASMVDHTGVFNSTTELTWLDVTPRVWVRRYNQ